MIEILAAEADYDRLDLFLAEKLEVSRKRAQDLIVNDNIRAEKRIKPSMKVMKGQKFYVEFPESCNMRRIEGEPVDFEVVYEDEYLLVINKPAGVVVHPGPGNWHNTLVNGLIYRYPEIARMPGGWLRPGIVHRLDGGTSGLMIVARDVKTMGRLGRMFQYREIDKQYIALAHGRPKKSEAVISGPIDHDPDDYYHQAIVAGGKPSLTGYKVLWTRNDISLVNFKLYTGRTHQIRVHFSALGCPLVGDTAYGAKDSGIGRILLHSWKLAFMHPMTDQKLYFRKYIPEEFTRYINENCR